MHLISLPLPVLTSEVKSDASCSMLDLFYDGGAWVGEGLRETVPVKTVSRFSAPGGAASGRAVHLSSLQRLSAAERFPVTLKMVCQVFPAW